MDPGLGKTSCSLQIISILREQGYIKRALVIAPLRPVYMVWPQEITKWSNFNHLKYHILHGPGKNVYHIDEDVDIVLMNPEGLLWLFDERFGTERFDELGVDCLVIDESTRFKSSTTKRFKMLRKHLNDFKRRYILTGSISPNGLLDLFGQIYVLDQGHALGQYVTHYRQKYFYRDWDGQWIPGHRALERISERISPLVLQLSAEDHLNMPELITTDVEIDLPQDTRAAYKAVETEFMFEMASGDPIVAANSAVAGGKCRQIANGRCYFDDEVGVRQITKFHSEKLAALEDLVEELSGHPLLVLYEFKHDFDQINERWPGTPNLSGMGMAKATRLVEQFNEGKVPMLCGHPASMGHGLNLQGYCKHVVWFSITWNFEHYDQAIRRVYRQGQEAEHVFVYHIMARNTRDQKVAAVLKRKERTQQDLYDALTEPV